VPKGNQFSVGSPHQPSKRPPKIRDEVTANLIFLCLFYVALGGAAMVMLVNWISS
jgi:hypothetical protein